MDWRAESLKNGIAERDFWKMTLGEVIRASEAHTAQLKERARLDFLQALSIGLFFGSAISGKNVPKIEDIYPEFFGSEEAEEARKKAEEEERMSRSAANFMNFATAFNKRFEQNGDRELKSENNG